VRERLTTLARTARRTAPAVLAAVVLATWAPGCVQSERSRFERQLTSLVSPESTRPTRVARRGATMGGSPALGALPAAEVRPRD
jgi:hypothetical protein